MKITMTTLFWVGEPDNDENDYITNICSYWDKDWEKNYGGVDDPKYRKGYFPAGFTPRENPFYVALPYGEFLKNGKLKRRLPTIVPWYSEWLTRKNRNVPLLKNRWVEITRGKRVCYAQWEDVGPFGENDFSWVFGSAPNPRNTYDMKAGLDVSPAVWDYLGMTDNGLTSWRFFNAAEMPNGPWNEIITTSCHNR
jgi:hypothetical protein